MRTYNVRIGDLVHTMQLDDDDVKLYQVVEDETPAKAENSKTDADAAAAAAEAAKVEAEKAANAANKQAPAPANK